MLYISFFKSRVTSKHFWHVLKDENIPLPVSENVQLPVGHTIELRVLSELFAGGELRPMVMATCMGTSSDCADGPKRAPAVE